MLSEEMITELIPVIGPRAIFLSYWRETFKKKLSLTVNSKEVPKVSKKKSEFKLVYYIHFYSIFVHNGYVFKEILYNQFAQLQLSFYYIILKYHFYIIIEK